MEEEVAKEGWGPGSRGPVGSKAAVRGRGIKEQKSSSTITPFFCSSKVLHAAKRSLSFFFVIMAKLWTTLLQRVLIADEHPSALGQPDS